MVADNKPNPKELEFYIVLNTAFLQDAVTSNGL